MQIDGKHSYFFCSCSYLIVIFTMAFIGQGCGEVTTQVLPSREIKPRGPRNSPHGKPEPLKGRFYLPEGQPPATLRIHPRQRLSKVHVGDRTVTFMKILRKAESETDFSHEPPQGRLGGVLRPFVGSIFGGKGWTDERKEVGMLPATISGVAKMLLPGTLHSCPLTFIDWRKTRDSCPIQNMFRVIKYLHFMQDVWVLVYPSINMYRSRPFLAESLRTAPCPSNHVAEARCL